VLGCLIASAAWLLFWGRRRPKRLILMTALVPTLSLGYVIACAIVFTIFVPNQPDQFFGDFSEPLPNGYVLTGLGKMPEYAYLDTETPGRNQPALLGGIKSLEQDGEIVYGAYSHPQYGSPEFFAPPDTGYFEFDTRSRQVRNFKTVEELNAAAGRPVHLVDSQFFRSQIPGRLYLRKVENAIYVLPPIAWLLFCLYRLVRFRLRGEEETKTGPDWPAGGLGLST
jgi:hypothetical protein